ncbi:inorganic diphosphatase, partial [gut metagenome]
VYGAYTDIDQLPKEIIRRLVHYFTTYKDIPGENKKRMVFINTYGASEAKEVIRRSEEDYKEYIQSLGAGQDR